jgi:hypothetical protein
VGLTRLYGELVVHSPDKREGEMAEKVYGRVVDRVTTVGAAAEGELVQITFEINAHAIIGLMTGGGMAYEEQLKALGEQVMADKFSFTRFQPSDAVAAHAVNPAGDRLVVLRLKHKGYPAVDVELSPDDARGLAGILLKTANEDPPQAPKIQ